MFSTWPLVGENSGTLILREAQGKRRCKGNSWQLDEFGGKTANKEWRRAKDGKSIGSQSLPRASLPTLHPFHTIFEHRCAITALGCQVAAQVLSDSCQGAFDSQQTAANFKPPDGSSQKSSFQNGYPTVSKVLPQRHWKDMLSGTYPCALPRSSHSQGERHSEVGRWSHNLSVLRSLHCMVPSDPVTARGQDSFILRVMQELLEGWWWAHRPQPKFLPVLSHPVSSFHHCFKPLRDRGMRRRGAESSQSRMVS